MLINSIDFGYLPEEHPYPDCFKPDCFQGPILWVDVIENGMLRRFPCCENHLPLRITYTFHSSTSWMATYYFLPE